VSRRGWLLYVAVAALGGIAYYLVPPFAKSGPFFNVLGISSVLAILAGAKMHRPETRLPWMLFACGQALFIAGDVITYNYPTFFHTDIPFPSVGDFFYLSVYPCLIAGILLLIHRRRAGRDRDTLIDSLIVTIGIGLLSWEFLMAPYAHDHTLTLLVKAISLAYPLMDLLLLAVVFRLAVGSGRREGSFHLLVIGSLALLATDAAYGLIQLSGVIYQNGGPLEAGWLSFYVLWGAAALHPSMRTLADPAPASGTEFPRGRLFVLGAASLMAPAVMFAQISRGEVVDLPVVVGSVALFMLCTARMNGLIRRHQQAELRERTLREAAGAFVTASTREELYAAAIHATRIIVGPDPSVRLRVAEGGDDLRLVASSRSGSAPLTAPPLRLTALPQRLRLPITEGHPVEVTDPEPELLEAMGWGPETRALAMAPLMKRDELFGLLVVAGERPLPRPARDSMEALASQAALALESASLAEDLHRRRSEARFASFVQNSSDVMTVIHADSTVKYVSPSIHRVLGYGPEEVTGTRLLDFVHPDDVERVLTLLSEVGDRGGNPQAVEFRWRHRDGRWVDVETLWQDLALDANVGGILLNTRDVSERKAFEEQLSHQTFHDATTGLANRALFQDRVEHALSRQQRGDQAIAVLFMDLDDFKTINDSLGHAVGDELLAEVARRVRACLRSADTVARLGGDEFGVLVENAGYERAAEVAERLLQSLEPAVRLEGKEVFVRASIGIAMGDDDRRGPAGAEELLRNADVAMYTAKSQGKGRYRLFEPKMHSEVLRRLELKADLQRAVDSNEFVVHYQPVVVLNTGRISGVEALVRWRHPTQGVLPPLEFIPLAEETGLIVPIGRWVLQEACKQAVRFQARVPDGQTLTMSVNLSARQLQHPDLVEEVRQALQSTGLEPSSLVLEITETVMMADVEMSLLRLEELKQLGVRLAIDDFGTGYSSLTYLRRFPIDILKVDKSFVDEVNKGSEEAVLAAKIIELAASLQMMPVAEGIERPEQLERLLQLECDLGQGFYFARPLAPPAVDELLVRNADPRFVEQ
jgi:diguanylate cyclase (GGDEF)-like protein/PAS domain S-box-containing protein